MLLTTSGATWVHTTQQRQTEMVTLTCRLMSGTHTHLDNIHALHTAPRNGGKCSLNRSEDILCGTHNFKGLFKGYGF